MQNFLTEEPFGDRAVVLTGDEHHHATRACRVRLGEEIGVSDGRGRRVIARIEYIDHQALRAVILRDVSGEGEPVPVLTIALAVIRPALFELAVEKCTESGVRGFVPILTARCEANARRFNPGRLVRIARESAKQSARSFVPEITEPVALHDYLRTLDSPALVASQRATETLETALSRLPKMSALVCFIGPEGDFTKNEYGLIQKAGVVPVSLGGLTLRSETAAMVGAARILANV